MPIDDDNKDELNALTYAYDDQDHIRKNIGNKLVNAFKKNLGSTEWGGVRLVIKNVKWDPDKKFNLTEQKKALLNDDFLSIPMKGDIELYDSKTGELLDHIENKSLLHVPYYTDRGTFIHKSNEYSTLRQLRLRPGVYSRRRSNGELESQFNVDRGSGAGFRITLNPATGIYKFNVGQSSTSLYSILHDMGVSDEEMADNWGVDVMARNKAHYDARALEKVYSKMIKKDKSNLNKNLSREAMANALKDSFENSKIDADIRKSNLGF